MADTVIGEVKKNSSETIRVTATVFNDIELIDARVYAQQPVGEAIPTRKGLSLREKTWRELLPILTGAVAVDGGDSSGKGRETSEEGAATQG